jgi:hypothetical protein
MMVLSWTQQAAATQEKKLRMETILEISVQLGHYNWNNSSPWISFSGETPWNAPAKLFQTPISLIAGRINSDCQRMLREVNLVLVRRGHRDCTDPGDVDDPEWVKRDDEIGWEWTVSCCEELRVVMSDLPLETCNQEWEMWDVQLLAEGVFYVLLVKKWNSWLSTRMEYFV